MSMPPAVSRSGLFASVRSRVVAIAIIPSLIFICAVLGVGWYQSENALRVRSSATLVGDGVDAMAAFHKAVIEERRVGVRGGDDPAAARAATDRAADEVRVVTGRVPADAPAGVRAAFARLDDAVAAVGRARRDIDDGARDLDAYRAYAPVVEPLAGVLGVGSAPGGDPDGNGNVGRDVVADLGAAGDLLAAAEAVRAAGAVAATAGPRGLDVPAYRALDTKAGPVAAALRSAVAALPAARRDAGTSLLDSVQWRTFTTNADRLLAAGPNAPGPAADAPRGADRVAADRAAADRGALVDDLTSAGDLVAAKATDLAFGTAHDAAARAVDRANTTLNVIVGIVLGVVALVVAAMLAAMRTGNRLGGRVAALQAGTQRTSAVLPALLDRIRRGEAVDVDAELPIVDHGTDEIGEVASAVDEAQRTAVAAAAEEARTRAGANAVFLNIAHRSQAIVHRQLQVLDDAERAENDSDQLARLFQLDHLSTRERRNAENLIIMGGEEPRRRWRRPVPLAEIIRSAVSESEQYTRITLGDTPDRHVEGAAVGDLIHLLAELVDNATSFSPPQCPIDISASIVGRGVAVEIEDRGLGIDPEPRTRLNAMLAAPPDFGLLTLSEDARLGLFVVARLADRHGVRVTLLESTYGGVQALVLVPNALLVAEPGDEPPADGETDRGTDEDGALDREGNGFATANGRHTDPDGVLRPRDGGAVAHRSPTTTAPDRVASPRHQPPAPSSPAAARPQPPAGSPQAPTAAPPSAGKPALPERRPGSASAVSPASTMAASAEPAAASTPASPATASVRRAAASTAAAPPAQATAPAGSPTAADDPEPDAAVTAALPKVMGVAPLPERRPQGHLAKGLRGRPATETPDAAASGESAEPAAGRTSTAMSALQSGTRRSRKATAETKSSAPEGADGSRG
jgi:signal transduction histidine kinase